MNKSDFAEVYKMLDSVPFSRNKKNIHRDFSDAIMMAELISHFNPKLVELHNYPPANALNKKINNWNTLHLKSLKKLGISLTKQQIEDIANSIPGAVEEVLYQVFVKF